MKKFCLIFLILILFGCESTKIKNVDVKTNGYSSELIASIDYKDSFDHFLEPCDTSDYCLSVYKEQEQNDEYKINFEQKTIEKIDSKENQNEYFLYYKNEKKNYSIYYKSDYTFIDDKAYLKHTYYYEKDGQMDELYVENAVSNSEMTNTLKTLNDYYRSEFYFCIKENDHISINRVDDGKLIQVDTIPLIIDDYKMTDYGLNENGFIVQYENEHNIKVTNDNKEKIYNKELDDYTLIYASLIYEENLRYENEESILYLIDGKELKFDKVIDDYVFSHYRYINDEYQIFYQNDNALKLFIGDKVFDIKNNTQYFSNKDYILYTYKDDNRELHTIYIDLKEKQEYELSESFDLYDVHYRDNQYLIKKYGEKGTSSYKVLVIDNGSISLVELPFDYYVEFIGFVNDKQLVFTNKNEDNLDIYLVTIKK